MGALSGAAVRLNRLWFGLSVIWPQDFAWPQQRWWHDLDLANLRALEWSDLQAVTASNQDPERRVGIGDVLNPMLDRATGLEKLKILFNFKNYTAPVFDPDPGLAGNIRQLQLAGGCLAPRHFVDFLQNRTLWEKLDIRHGTMLTSLTTSKSDMSIFVQKLRQARKSNSRVYLSDVLVLDYLFFCEDGGCTVAEREVLD